MRARSQIDTQNGVIVGALNLARHAAVLRVESPYATVSAGCDDNTVAHGFCIGECVFHADVYKNK